MSITVRARPIIKWAGGKQQLAGELTRRFPAEYGTYYEPFLGGASVFLEVDPERAVVGDSNAWLIDTYRAIRRSPGQVAAALDELPNTKEAYLRIRAVDPADLDLTTRAAHFIYLNKTGFRGLFRVNRQGRFNVPYGAYDRRTYDLEQLRAFSRRLRGVDLRAGDYLTTLDGIGAGDFVYFDPPYYKIGGHSDFNRYTASQFRESDHERLADLCRELDRSGVRWALSNSDTPFVRRLYRGFRWSRIASRREINLRSQQRDIEELLITNE